MMVDFHEERASGPPAFEAYLQDAETLDRSTVVDELGGVMQN
jgi:hypothetical protein